jgi:hypothetical protein
LTLPVLAASVPEQKQEETFCDLKQASQLFVNSVPKKKRSAVKKLRQQKRLYSF